MGCSFGKWERCNKEPVHRAAEPRQMKMRLKGNVSDPFVKTAT